METTYSDRLAVYATGKRVSNYQREFKCQSLGRLNLVLKPRHNICTKLEKLLIITSSKVTETKFVCQVSHPLRLVPVLVVFVPSS